MRSTSRFFSALALIASLATPQSLVAASPDERDGREPDEGADAPAAAPAAPTGTVVSAELVLQEGDTAGGDTVSILNSPFTNGLGDPGFVAGLANSARIVWSGAGVIFLSTDAVGVTLAGGESTMGIGDAGQFIYSPSVDGDDAVWTQAGALLVDGQPAPGFPPGVTNTFNSRPHMLPSGRAYWVSGFNESGGTSTEGRMLYTSADGTPATISLVLRSDDLIGGIPIDRPSGIGFDYQVSDNVAHHIHQLLLDTGSTTDDDIVYLDGAIVARETFPTGQGDNWDNLDNVTVNDFGRHAFSGDTDGATGSDEFIAFDGAIVVREGNVVDGVTLGSSVNALSLNNLGRAVFIWSISGGEALFYSCDPANLATDAVVVLRTGDELDVDGGGGDGLFVDDFNASNVIGPGLWLAEDGRVFVEIDVSDGEVDFEAIVGLQLPACAAEPEIDVDPPAIESTQAPDTLTATSLDVANLGTATLDYLLAEAPIACATPADVPWLALDAAGGAVAPAGIDAIGVTLDSTGLAPGVYTAVICVQSNDADESLVPVPVTLTVVGEAPPVQAIPALGPAGLAALALGLGALGARALAARRRRAAP